MSKFQVGDRVRVRKPADVEKFPQWADEMDKFDGTVQVIRRVYTSDEVVGFDGDPMNWNFHFDWLDPMRSWVPDGYSVVEIAVPDAMAASIGAGNALVWKKARVGDRWLCHTENEVDVRQRETDWFLNVIVPTTPPAPKYREPTQADVGKMVEVSDCGNRWQAYQLLAVLPQHIKYPIAVDGVKGFVVPWRDARIKNEEAK